MPFSLKLNYFQIITLNPLESLKSECWKYISLHSVQNVMLMDNLGVKEVEVVTALLRWGRQQVFYDQGNVFDGDQLRAEIGSCLPLIRFTALSPAEFIQLCQDDLKNVLNDNEKFLLLMCITLDKWDHMPEHLRISLFHRARIGPPFAFQLPYSKCSNICEAHSDDLSFSLAFEVSSKVSFIGIRVLPTEDTIDAPDFGVFQFFVCYSEFDGTLGKGRSGKTIPFDGKEYCEVTPKCVLDPGVKYRLKFTFPICRFVHRFYPYALQNAKHIVKKGSVSLKLFSSSVCANVSELLFELV
jgi:hypothetical protein